MSEKLLLTLVVLFFTCQLQAQNTTIPAEVIDVETYGGWETKDQSGYYRIVTKQFGYEHVVAHVFVEWISVDREGKSVVKTVPISEINEPSVYAVRIQKNEGEEIQFVLTNVYTLTESTLKIKLKSLGQYKVAV